MPKKISDKSDNKKYFDLICGMELALAEVKYTAKYAGEKYYFCGGSCFLHFQHFPQRYAPDYQFQFN